MLWGSEDEENRGIGELQGEREMVQKKKRKKAGIIMVGQEDCGNCKAYGCMNEDYEMGSK